MLSLRRMFVQVMQVGKVRVRVGLAVVLVPMAVRLFVSPVRMLMPVMLIVAMSMIVADRLMGVLMLMSLGQVQIHAQTHQHSGQEEDHR